jgi:hypothetical protein
MSPLFTGPTPGDQVPPALRGHGARRAVLATVTATVLGIMPAIVLATPAYALPGDFSQSSDLEVAEGDPITFDLIREGGAPNPSQTLNYAVTGTATSGDDFEAFSGSTTFSASSNTVTKRFTLRGISDAIDELDETVIVTFTDPGNANAVVATFNHLLTDDDATPTYSFSAPNPVLESAGNATVTATLSAESGLTVKIPVSTSDGTALDGQDYVAIADSIITINPGDTTGTVDIPVTDDLLDEADTQTINVAEGTANLRENVQARVGNYAVNIGDNDALPVASVQNPANANEGSPLTFEVTLDSLSERTVTVTTDTSDGTATAGSDYTAVPSNLVTFAPGDDSEDVVITTLGDTRNEATPETVNLTLSAPSLATLDPDHTVATGGIDDDDVLPTISLTPGDAVEGDSNVNNRTFTVTLSAAAGRTVTVGYSTSAGTATAGSDFDNVTPGVLTFAPGETIKTFDVPVHGDTVDEADETFNIVLSNPNTTLGASASLGTTAITILDDDNTPTLNNPADISRPEGTTAAVFPLTLSNASQEAITLDVAMVDGSADVDDIAPGNSGPGSNDYDAPTATVTFLPGETTKNVTINVNADSVFETDETATLQISIPVSETDIGGTGQDALLTLENDDAAPTVALSQETGAEGTTLAVKATVTHVAQAAIAVELTAAGSGPSPAEGGDFVDPGTFSTNIPAGDNTGGAFTILMLDAENDTIDEAAETVLVSLTDPNGDVDPADALQTITDDLTDLPPSIALGDESIAEAATTVDVPVVLTYNAQTNNALSTEQDLVIDYSTADDTATAGSDYTAASNGAQLTIPSTDPGGIIQVPILEDAAYELDETFTVEVDSVNLSGAVVVDGTAEVTILQNDLGARPGFSVAPTQSVAEGSGPASVVVTLTSPAPQDVTFDVTATGDTAEDVGSGPGSNDYDAPLGQVTVLKGASQASITVPINNDTVYEAAENLTIEVGLAAGESDAVGTADETVLTITDTDAAPTVTLSAAPTAEGDEVAVMATVVGVAQEDLTADITLVGQANGVSGNAAEVGDFVNATPDLVTIPGGDNTAAPVEVYRFLANADTVDEATETVHVTLDDQNAVIAGSSIYASITDDTNDLPPSVSVADVTVNENAGHADVTVDLDFDQANGADSTELPVTVYYATEDDGATAGSDYTAAADSANVVITPNNLSGTIQIPILEDSAYELDENLLVKVTSVTPTGGAVTDDEAVVTIASNDLGSRPSFSVANTSKAEGAGAAQFTIQLTSPAPQDVAFTVTAHDGSAVDDATTVGTDDYDLPLGTATVLKGSSTVTIDVPVNDDAVFEATETMTLDVELAGGETDATGSLDTSTLTITDPDAAPTVTINTETGAEGTNIAVVATVDGATQDAIPLQVTLAGASRSGSDAAEVPDFVNAGPVTVNIPAGEHDEAQLPLREFRANNDTVDENVETVVATATDQNAHVTTASNLLRINDDVNDTAPTVSIADAPVDEDDGPAVVDVDLGFTGETTGTERTVVVNYTTVNGTATAPGQYTTRTGHVDFAPGVTTGQISVPIVVDAVDEPDQTFRVDITSVTPGDATVIDDSATVTIVDDDADVPPPTFSVANVSVAENGGAAEFSVVLSHESSQVVTFDVALQDDTAVDVGAGPGSNDFNAPSATVNIPAGQLTGTITVPINNDLIFEHSERADLQVSLADGEADATGPMDESTLTITDDETTPSISLNSTSNTEGEDVAVTATYTGRVSQDALVFDLSFDGDGTGEANAAEELDYEDTEQQATIPAGTPTGSTIILRQLHFEDDTIDEPVETVKVVVTDTDERIATRSSTYRINDDLNDLAPSVSVNDETIGEEEGSVGVGVTLNFNGQTTATERNVTVSYHTLNGSAKAPVDYVAGDSFIVIEAGDEIGYIDVPIVDDGQDENDQNFFVKLDGILPNDSGIDDDTGEIAILDDDATVNPTLLAPTGRVGAGPVTVSGMAREGTQVQLWTAPGTSGDNFNVVAYTTADVNGNYSFTRTLPTGYRLYTRANGLNSPIRTLRIQHSPVLNGGSTGKGVVDLTVVGNPKLAGLAVQIQRLDAGGKWTTVASGRTASNGQFSKKLTKLKSGTAITYRAYIAGDTAAGLLSGVSTTKRIGIR